MRKPYEPSSGERLAFYMTCARNKMTVEGIEVAYHAALKTGRKAWRIYLQIAGSYSEGL